MDPQQDAVSPLTSGDALMGRYLLVEELTSTHPWAFRWLAQDKILRRQVEVYLLLGPHVDDAIDAARSAALIRDPRLVRIIDAGHYGGVSFVLTEPLPGTPMTDLIPLDSGQSRALTGEVASALAIARQSDVHHGSLRPELVYLHSNPPLVIGGLGWDAALWGEAPSDHAEAEARDAEGVTALLYTALTGRWPGRLPSTVAPPPGEPGAPVKPSLIAGGVPGDLDALCEIALGPGGAGPTTLADVIDDLGPWLGRRDDPRVAALLGSRPSVVLPPMPDSGPGVSPSPWDGPASGGAADAGEPAGAHAAPRRGPAAPPVAPVLASVAPAMPAPLPEPPVPDVPAAAVPQAPAAPVSPELVLPAPSPAPASRVSALSEASSGPEVLTRHGGDAAPALATPAAGAAMPPHKPSVFGTPSPVTQAEARARAWAEAHAPATPHEPSADPAGPPPDKPLTWHKARTEESLKAELAQPADLAAEVPQDDADPLGGLDALTHFDLPPLPDLPSLDDLLAEADGQNHLLGEAAAPTGGAEPPLPAWLAAEEDAPAAPKPAKSATPTVAAAPATPSPLTPTEPDATHLTTPPAVLAPPLPPMPPEAAEPPFAPLVGVPPTAEAAAPAAPEADPLAEGDAFLPVGATPWDHGLTLPEPTTAEPAATVTEPEPDTAPAAPPTPEPVQPAEPADPEPTEPEAAAPDTPEPPAEPDAAPAAETADGPVPEPEPATEPATPTGADASAAPMTPGPLATALSQPVEPDLESLPHPDYGGNTASEAPAGDPASPAEAATPLLPDLAATREPPAKPAPATPDAGDDTAAPLWPDTAQPAGSQPSFDAVIAPPQGKKAKRRRWFHRGE